MNVLKITRLISSKTGLEEEFTHKMVSFTVSAIASFLEEGHDVTLNGLGRFYWKEAAAKRIHHPATRKFELVPKRMKLKFRPAIKLRSRPMNNDEGMEKYAVVLDDKTKEASSGKTVDRCPAPNCGRKLDSGGACPEHGTEPQEKK